MDEPVWEDGAWRPLPTLGGDASADACVIGLGGSGLSCMHELLDAGLSTIGIDAGGVAAGAAGRNGGFLLAGSYHFHHDAVSHYGRARARAIYALTLEQISRIAAETPAAVRRVGSLRIAMSPEEAVDCTAQLEAMRADGLPVEPYDGAEGSGLLFPMDAAFNPLLRCRLLAASALKRGARLYERTAALRVEAGRVLTSHGVIRCGLIFVATDGGILRLLPELARRVRIARLQMLATAPTDDVTLPRPVYARYGYEYWQQLPDRRIALGGFRDLGGEEEWTEDTAASPLIQQALERHLREFIGVNAPVERRWAASVGYTADGMPVLETVQPGVWAFGAYSGTGNVIGALCGRAAAQLATRGVSPLADPFLAAADRPGGIGGAV